MYTTLNKIRAHGPCGLDPRAPQLTGFCKLRAHLGTDFDPDAPVSILAILESNGLDDALWCLRAVDGHEAAIRKLACDFALDVAHLWATPPLVRQYLETQDENIRDAARDAAGAAGDAAWAAARDAARAAARAAAGDAGDAAWDAAGDIRAAAGVAAEAKQNRRLTRMLLAIVRESG